MSEKLYRIVSAVFTHVLYALTIGGCIVALYCDQLVIALLCAAAYNFVKGMSEANRIEWKE